MFENKQNLKAAERNYTLSVMEKKKNYLNKSTPHQKTWKLERHTLIKCCWEKRKHTPNSRKIALFLDGKKKKIQISSGDKQTKPQRI